MRGRIRHKVVEQLAQVTLTYWDADSNPIFEQVVEGPIKVDEGGTLRMNVSDATSFKIGGESYLVVPITEEEQDGRSDSRQRPC